MDLFEYQARAMFEDHGVPVLPGILARTPADAQSAAARLGGTTVVKAQVKVGGRGKAGGVQLAHSSEEARAKAHDMLGMDLHGHTVHQVMITSGIAIEEEYYVSILVDRARRGYTVLCSLEGGMDIEQLAVEKPEALHRFQLDSITGIDDAQAQAIVARTGFPKDIADDVAEVLLKLWEVFRTEDASLVEVNPLIRSSEGKVLALDGKVSLDANANFRHPEHADFEDTTQEDPLERKAKSHGLNYVKLDGEVGIIGNGAGLVMSTLDVVTYAGEHHGGVRPANFLDIGGGASAEVMTAGLDIILHDPQVNSVFVNVFGGITACDVVAEGIVTALNMLGDSASKPLVVRLDGNEVEAGRQILEAAGHQLVTLADSMDAGAEQAARLAYGNEA